MISGVLSYTLDCLFVLPYRQFIGTTKNTYMKLGNIPYQSITLLISELHTFRQRVQKKKKKIEEDRLINLDVIIV